MSTVAALGGGGSWSGQNYAFAANTNIALPSPMTCRSYPPPSPVMGEIYFDTSDMVVRLYDGYVWLEFVMAVAGMPAPPPAPPPAPVPPLSQAEIAERRAALVRLAAEMED